MKVQERLLAATITAMLLSVPLAEAKDAVPNLGGGLDELAVPSKSLLRAAAPELSATHPVRLDDAGRVLVRISLNGKVPAASVLQSLRATSGVAVAASDLNYRAGVIEAYVPTSGLRDLARKAGVLAVVPSSLMVTNVGVADSQGLVQHRVNRIKGVDGKGITVGVMSDSFDTAPGDIRAADDVATGDLPGPGNPFGNTEPVVVFEDWVPGATDEGRAMAQIVHDLAPKARLGFATANGTELNMADNIRSLAGLPGGSKAIPGFKADVIVDDIVYYTEPFFQDGIIAQAVDEVAAAGVSYFSSAGNRPATMGYDSKLRIVPASEAANSGLNFANVPPELYAGGFHNFDEGSGVDISQTVQIGGGSRIVMQWNEPYDPAPPTPVGPPLAAGTGTVPPGGDTRFTFQGTAGTVVEIFADADNTTTGTPNPDLTLEVFDPNGNSILFVDNTTNPESAILELSLSGTYTVVVDSFQPDQSGDFVYRVQQVSIEERVLTDYNLLFFFNGNFVFASAEQNRLTNRPVEFIQLPGALFQIVIARANTPPAKNRNVADRIRYVGFSSVQPLEHFSYHGPITYGHNSANGASGVAAYAAFAPFVPEPYTSSGPSTIYFDKHSKRLRHPEIRQKPDLAAMDGANNTFFGDDADEDDDDQPNFFGTSAAAPHAAAIAALVLDAAGGPGKVKPKRMREILQNSAFRHDLDPYWSSGFALSKWNLLAVNAQSDWWTSVSRTDPNVFTLTNVGNKRLKSFSLNLSDANPTETPDGLVFDTRPGPNGQPFVIGRTLGLTPADVTGTASIPAGPPAVAGQWSQLDLTFKAGSFRSGDLLSFGIDRDEADGAGALGTANGRSADLLGDGVLIPSGEVLRSGARFFGTYEDGSRFSGEFFNLIGRGWTDVDGYGFINAEAAVRMVQKK
jgi:subtilase family protein